MSMFFTSVVAFIIALGVLVAVHEFGHFWVARKMGVKVLRFAVGFGQPLLAYRSPKSGVEYAICQFPLGGYVKMLDDAGPHEAEYHQAFNNKSVWARIAILAAGPMANFLLAILIYALVFMIGIEGYRPLVGDVKAGSFAQAAGIEKGEEIIAVNGQSTKTWQEVRLALIDAVLDSQSVDLQLKSSHDMLLDKQIHFGNTAFLKEQSDIIEKLGLSVWVPEVEPVIHTVVADSAAAKYGLQSGDRIVQIDDVLIHDWSDFANYISTKPDQAVVMQIERNHQPLTLNVVAGSTERGNKTVGFLGAGYERPEGLDKLWVTVKYPVFEALAKGLIKTWDMSLLTLRMLGKLIVGEASTKNISGPITIADYAGKSASIGLSYFLDFMAIVSVSLGVLNLLPIPLLDGGRLLYYAIEVLKGSPVSERFQIIGQNIGLVILACLMSLAFYNDLTRIFGLN